ncbi:MAG: autotransporter outer membrane beta-barrel domain-containing protein [Granulosicoccus sp.]
MNKVSGVQLLCLILSQCFIVTSCSTTGSSGTEVVGPPPPPSDTTPLGQDNLDAGLLNRNTAETINKDLDNTVETVKGRNSSQPNRGIFFSLGMLELERTSESGDERTGSDSDITNLVLGYDQSLSDTWVVGSLLDLSRRSASATDNIEEPSFSSDSFSVYLFSSLTLKNSLEISAYGGLGSADVSSTRFTEAGTFEFSNINTNMPSTLEVDQGEVQGNSDSSLLSAGLNVTRRTSLGARNQLILRAEVDFSRFTTDAFTEQGTTNSEFAIRESTRENLRWTLSGGISRTYTGSIGVFVPAITLGFVRDDPEIDDIVGDLVSNPNSTAAFDPAPIDRSYGQLDLDLVLVRPHGIQFFGNINSNFSNRFEDSRGINIGARLEF